MIQGLNGLSSKHDPFVTIITNDSIILCFSILWLLLLIQEKQFLRKSKASFSFDIHYALTGHITSPTPCSEGLGVDVIPRAENLVGDMVDSSCVIEQACNPLMISLVRNHYRSLMSIAPPALLVRPVVI